jgi:sodium/potassium-transporting ATPase subunit alpha
MFPGFALAFESGELDLMLRKPRGKNDHLFSLKLLCVGYVQMGSLQTFGLFLCYFYTFDNFGFKFFSLFYLQFREGVVSLKTDVYDPYRPDHGNTKIGDICAAMTGSEYDIPDDFRERVDWQYLLHATVDLRNTLVKCDGFGSVIPAFEWGECYIKQLSPITHVPVCYTTEALKYAQTSGFFAIVIGQYANLIAVKTKKLSIYYQGMSNFMIPIGLGSELVLTLVLAYLLPIQRAFGTRDLIFYHFGLAAFPFAILHLVYDEFRKYMIRNAKAPSAHKPNWWVRNYSY